MIMINKEYKTSPKKMFFKWDYFLHNDKVLSHKFLNEMMWPFENNNAIITVPKKLGVSYIFMLSYQ